MEIITEMERKHIEELLAELMLTCGFGTIIAPVTSVTGGLLHQMYKVITNSGTYAVKHLNTEIMSRPDALENYARAERMECLLEKEDIPIVPSITVHGNKMQNINGQYFYIFHWQDGHITDWNNISNDECNMAGNILGRIHAIDPQNVSHKEPELSKIDWHTYILKAKEEKSEIAAVLADNEELLIYAEKELNKARKALPDIICLSDEDMDPKNIMWNNGEPWVIDLECLDHGNPISHALQLALQWSGIVTRDIKVEKIAAFFDGYLEAYDNCFRAYSDVFGLAYTWVEWLEYNIQRALGTCMDESERTLGISEFRNTIDRIKYIRNNERNIKAALDFCLPRIKTAGFDNHDDRICYYELLLEKDITEVTQFKLPEGYSFVSYSDTDRDTWIDIEISAKEFSCYEQGLEAWNRYFAARIDELPNRMFFIENDRGEKIATATALYDIYGRDTSNSGWLHWVAVRREYQGRGLSKPLITYVLRVMNDLGYKHAKIPTQTNTWLACKVYLDLGFLPIEANMKRNHEGWRIVKALTGHSALQIL